jgi:hypothetical protein
VFIQANTAAAKLPLPPTAPSFKRGLPGRALFLINITRILTNKTRQNTVYTILQIITDEFYFFLSIDHTLHSYLINVDQPLL